ncbi:hypothetical protein KY290_031188 [Solanum tuberosum]|uniref:Aminotransferase-like plant mobile domain-containing protein n=1 Tax=Solanum tuberosum TaxID=4113 RepID=A0ABQ7UBV9_SOLTU|nr:hypothetical protein KY290_031188 [Solanum tuberosum]
MKPPDFPQFRRRIPQVKSKGPAILTSIFVARILVEQATEDLVSPHSIEDLTTFTGVPLGRDIWGLFLHVGFANVPGALIKHHYDGSLQALVQLWDSCVHLGSSSKIIIPMCLSNKGSLMIREDDASLPTKGEQLQEKLPHSFKSKTPKAANITDNEVIDVTLKRKKPFSSSDKSVEKSLGIAPSCSNTSKTSISLHEIGITTSAASSSNERNVRQELHWKRLKKKPKNLSNQQCEFAELDSISIDTAIFEDGAACSTMPLTELAHQGLGDIPCDVDVFENCITSLNSLNVVKSSHLPLAEVNSQVANEIQLTKLTVPFSEKAETSQNIITTNVGVGAHQIRCSNVFKDLIRPLLGIAPNFEPQKTISSFKLSYISGMWRSLYYDVARLSTSQKITRDSHQELLYAAQQCLDTTNEKKKTISLIEDHQKRLFGNQETITNREDEIHAIEKIIPLSKTEIKGLAKLKKDVETSRHQILSHKLFP